MDKTRDIFYLTAKNVIFSDVNASNHREKKINAFLQEKHITWIFLQLKIFRRNFEKVP